MSEPLLASGDLIARFQALDDFLLKHQALWRPRPFQHLHLPWESELPELAAWLRCRSLEQAEASDSELFALIAPAPFTDLARQAQALSQLGELPRLNSPERAHAFSVDVPGRKLAQIQAFASHLQFRQRPSHWLDWCSGKGHLGRWLTQDDQRLTCLEYDPSLVASGSALSARLRLNAEHLQQDVLADDCSERLQEKHTPVALHACGDLHVRLLQLASRKGCTQLAVAPCCYNRIAGVQYQALSAAAQASALQLSRDDLGLPLSETVTASARVRRQRDQSMAWRLAFDLLQRQLRGIDEYLPTPSLPSEWFGKPFARFCHDLATLRGVPSPGEQDWVALEAQGWQRLAEVRNLELLRNLFRRPLELWLLLDRALYLEDQGYRVRLGTFCDYQLSPRNLLLLAERPRVAHRSCG
ncbi:methyltransferase [Ectopseudomonas guguanensis]|uniref:Methyltransferase domain-containing protein n=1 Tax=Ectopseudomonas guguanensis TaxID=1198456 RepID=A0A1H0TM04_9GAMM|nr:methyltransferase [Pseudomonas guguanensis]SDP55003.1 Methyltransferase domain-containing protein [Pseudomonas guguanensis]